MKTSFFFSCLLPLLACLSVSSCQIHSPLTLRESDYRIAGEKESVKLNQGALALVGKGSSFSTSPNSATPAIVLKEGKVVVVKQHDGEVCDIIAGPAWARLVGTTVLAEKHGSVLRVISVEGTARVNWGNRIGEYRMLKTGEMLMVDESQQTLPNPVVVNLGKLLTREELLAPNLLGSEKLALIEAATKEQAARLTDGRLLIRDALPLMSATGSAESMSNGDSGRNARPVTTQVNMLSSQVLTTTLGGGGVGGTTGAVTQAVTQVLGGLLGL